MPIFSTFLVHHRMYLCGFYHRLQRHYHCMYLSFVDILFYSCYTSFESKKQRFCSWSILGGKLGYIANILTILWTIFCLVFLSFPYVRPVTNTNMNYVSAVYGGVILAVIICWFLYGKAKFIANKTE